MSTIILGIESSCDDTSASVIKDGFVLSNIIANQSIHEQYGGVVPELASRAHQQNIIPVVKAALDKAGINKSEISAIAFTNGPGLLGSLIVGTCFSKGLSMSLNVPMIEINHLQAHVLAHFIKEDNASYPDFPFLCLLVSGGNSQIIKVSDHLQMEIIGETIDDAAGEAFDKSAKIIGLPYPGGPLIDKLAKEGDPNKFTFAKPHIEGFNYSFSGLKTSILYYLQKQVALDPDFIEKNKADICASVQKTIIDILMDKLIKAAKETGIKEVAIAGGVSANSGLRQAILDQKEKRGWNVFIPKMAYSTDNAAMVAITGYYKFLKGQFADQTASPMSRLRIS